MNNLFVRTRELLHIRMTALTLQHSGTLQAHVNNKSTLFSDGRYQGGEKSRSLAADYSLTKNTPRRKLELVKVVFYPMLPDFCQALLSERPRESFW